MKRLFSTYRQPIDYDSYVDWLSESRKQKVCISSKNLIAFTTSFCLNSRNPTTGEFHVYLVDINKTFEPFLITRSSQQYELIEWDPDGNRLLVVDIIGTVQIFTIKDHLIDTWDLLYEHIFSGETYTACAWYHSGNSSYVINVPNEDLKAPHNHINYSEKIARKEWRPSLEVFGGQPAEGVLLVSGTGSVTALTFMSDNTVDVVSESLGLVRSSVLAADVSYQSDGNFLIATSSGAINSIVTFYQVRLQLKNMPVDDIDVPPTEKSKRVAIKTRRYYSFSLNVLKQMFRDSDNTKSFKRVNVIKFVTKETPNEVLIEIGGECMSLIELWELEPRKRRPTHSAIMDIIKKEQAQEAKDKQKSDDASPDDTKADSSKVVLLEQIQSPTIEGSKEWYFKGNYITDKELMCISVPNCKIFGENRQMSLILLSYSDSTICCLSKETMQPVGDTIRINCHGVDDLDLSDEIEENVEPSLQQDLLPQIGGDEQQQQQQPEQSGLQDNHNQHIVETMDTAEASQENEVLDERSETEDETIALQSSSRAGLSLSKTQQKISRVHATRASKRPRRMIWAVDAVTDLQFSPNHSLLVSIDYLSQLHFIRLPQLIPCQDKTEYEAYLQYLVEYAQIRGNDCLDLVIASKLEWLDKVAGQFQDAFERQPKRTQKIMLLRHLMIRGTLNIAVHNNLRSICSYTDCHVLIMLTSIYRTFYSILRQSANQAENLPEKISQILKSEECLKLTLFQVIQKLSHNKVEFAVEQSTIQLFKPHMQWVIEYCIFVVQSIPYQQNYVTLFPGLGPGRNPEHMLMLRELIVIIKIWSEMHKAAAPVFARRNEQVDVITQVYKLITDHYTMMHNWNLGLQFTLMDEVKALIGSLYLKEFNYFLTPTGLVGPMLFWPRYLMESDLEHHHDKLRDFHVEPNESGSSDGSSSFLIFEYFHPIKQPQIRGLDKFNVVFEYESSMTMDVVRFVDLGERADHKTRRCTRCRGVSLINCRQQLSGLTKHALDRWDNLWLEHCVCGGRWVQQGSLIDDLHGPPSPGVSERLCELMDKSLKDLSEKIVRAKIEMSLPDKSRTSLMDDSSDLIVSGILSPTTSRLIRPRGVITVAMRRRGIARALRLRSAVARSRKLRYLRAKRPRASGRAEGERRKRLGGGTKASGEPGQEADVGKLKRRRRRVGTKRLRKLAGASKRLKRRRRFDRADAAAAEPLATSGPAAAEVTTTSGEPVAAISSETSEAAASAPPPPAEAAGGDQAGEAAALAPASTSKPPGPRVSRSIRRRRRIRRRMTAIRKAGLISRPKPTLRSGLPSPRVSIFRAPDSTFGTSGVGSTSASSASKRAARLARADGQAAAAAARAGSAAQVSPSTRRPAGEHEQQAGALGSNKRGLQSKRGGHRK